MDGDIDRRLIDGDGMLDLNEDRPRSDCNCVLNDGDLVIDEGNCVRDDGNLLIENGGDSAPREPLSKLRLDGKPRWILARGVAEALDRDRLGEGPCRVRSAELIERFPRCDVGTRPISLRTMSSNDRPSFTLLGAKVFLAGPPAKVGCLPTGRGGDDRCGFARRWLS